jgi:hypothetical protein
VPEITDKILDAGSEREGRHGDSLIYVLDRIRSNGTTDGSAAAAPTGVSPGNEAALAIRARERIKCP